MSIFQNSSVARFTRGGQTLIHYWRMLAQVGKQLMTVCGVLFITLWMAFFFWQTSPYERYISAKYVWAYGALQINQPEAEIPIKLSDGRRVPVSALEFANNREVRQIIHGVYRTALTGLVLVAIGIGLLVVVAIRFFYHFGAGQGKDGHVRGAKLVSHQELKLLTRRQSKKRILKIGDVPIPDGVEQKHFLFVGGPGTGKSTELLRLLSQVFTTEASAILYDVAGEYVSRFYRPERDVILNPLDERCPNWSIWEECTHEYDFERFAASLIPESKGDPFWSSAARAVFTAIAFKMANDSERSNAKLVDLCLRVSDEEIIEFVKHTTAAALMNENSAKMTASIRGVLATYIAPFRYLPDGGEPFSIKHFVTDNADRKRLFLSSKQDQIKTLAPLISAWLDQAIFAQLSLDESKTRRNWLFIDELPSLQKLHALDGYLARSRKVGGCAVLAFQNYPQIKTTYGADHAESICGLCASWVVFSANDVTSAGWASKNLGSAETEEVSEGISYGANEIRDGVSLSKQRHRRELVIPTDLMHLPDFQAYVRFTRGYPLALVKFDPFDLEATQPPFLEASKRLTSGPMDIIERTPIPSDESDEMVISDAQAEPDIEHSSRQRAPQYALD